MAAIIQQTFADGDDKGLRLGTEEWGRVLAIGPAWTRLRIGILANLVPNGTSNIANAYLALGLSPSQSQHFGSQEVSLWYGCVFGVSTNGYGGGTLTHNAGSGNPYYTFGPHFNGRVVEGVGTGTGGTPPANGLPTSGGATARRAAAIVDFRKSGNSMVVRGALTAGASLTSDHSLSAFRQMMADPDDTTLGNPPELDGVALVSAFSSTDTDYATRAGSHGEVVAVHVGFNKELESQLNVFAIEAFRHA